MEKEVGNQDWVKLLGRGLIENQWGKFKVHYQHLTNKFIPHKTIRAGHTKTSPWLFGTKVKQAKSPKHAAWRLYKDNRLNINKMLFEKAALNEKDIIEQANLEYEGSIIIKVKDNAKAFYNYVGMYTKSSCTIDVLEVEGEKLYGD